MEDDPYSGADLESVHLVDGALTRDAHEPRAVRLGGSTSKVSCSAIGNGVAVNGVECVSKSGTYTGRNVQGARSTLAASPHPWRKPVNS